MGDIGTGCDGDGDDRGTKSMTRRDEREERVSHGNFY